MKKRSATTAKFRKKARVKKASYERRRTVGGPVVRGGPWTVPTYADSTVGDNVDGEDLSVRRAAVEALGPFNGAVVVVDTATGRILSMVNQKLALGSGFQPCSTIKVPVALAALSEGIIDKGSAVSRLGRHSNLTRAIATSSNPYFANLGIKLGYDRVSHYARLFGYGEKAGLDIRGEHPGHFPAAPPKNGGVGMLTSFGEEISQTPLQLAALMSAIANGGTLYYLQYPTSAAEVAHFHPRVKRHLNIQPYLPVLKPGMLGAVQFGTARRAQQEEPIAGKTGTCTESRTHLGWFGSFNDQGPRKLAVVVLLTGGGPAIGPQAAGIAGQVYKNLSRQEYFAAQPAGSPAASLISTQICCSVE
ncbi:MAG TPA: penicillin-binding transpeptidase domain-containing protein [Bryobacteraceae bacterium]|nr:penicillin-binding transpeptidase domain-containing protein [Bryobacteraceae bacterium]